MARRAAPIILVALLAAQSSATAGRFSRHRGPGISRQGLALRRLIKARRAAEARQVGALFEPSAERQVALDGAVRAASGREQGLRSALAAHPHGGASRSERAHAARMLGQLTALRRQGELLRAAKGIDTKPEVSIGLEHDLPTLWRHYRRAVDQSPVRAPAFVAAERRHRRALLSALHTRRRFHEQRIAQQGELAPAFLANELADLGRRIHSLERQGVRPAEPAAFREAEQRHVQRLAECRLERLSAAEVKLAYALGGERPSQRAAERQVVREIHALSRLEARGARFDLGRRSPAHVTAAYDKLLPIVRERIATIEHEIKNPTGMRTDRPLSEVLARFTALQRRLRTLRNAGALPYRVLPPSRKGALPRIRCACEPARRTPSR